MLKLTWLDWLQDLDQLADPEKVLDHDTRVLRIGGVKLGKLLLDSVVDLDPVCLSKLAFQGGVVQPGVEHVFGEFDMILQSIDVSSITKSLV